MPINVDLRDGELAEYLAVHLSDLEFELLVRKRIQLTYEEATGYLRDTQFCTSQAICEFNYKWEDKSHWHLRVGAAYKDSVYGDGEVLSITFRNAVKHWQDQHGNKLSLLLESPKD